MSNDVNGLLRQAARELTTVAGDAARLEAELLLALARQQSRARLLADLHQEVDEEQHAALLVFLQRRLSGEPLAYILGHREFMSLDFVVSPDVLVPRPETELLVAAALDVLRRGKWPWPAVIDVGTGCGNIALSLAHYWPPARLLAVDLSWAALEVARLNARRLGLEERVRFCRGDLLSPLFGGRHRAGAAFRAFVSLVVANLPYVPSAELPSLPSEVRREPALALDGGQDGLVLYRRLLRQVPLVLRPGGYLLVEVGLQQVQALVLALYRSGFSGTRVLKDAAGWPRVVVSKFAGRSQGWFRR